MSETGNAGSLTPQGGFRELWREVLAAIDDRILRACLPKDPQAIVLDEDRITISVESEFKKEYCLRKQARLEETIEKVIGPRQVLIGEPPLIERAREELVQRGTNARIVVLGIGDGGVNAIDRMRAEQLQGVRLIAADTDKQVLGISRAHEML